MDVMSAAMEWGYIPEGRVGGRAETGPVFRGEVVGLDRAERGPNRTGISKSLSVPSDRVDLTQTSHGTWLTAKQNHIPSSLKDDEGRRSLVQGSRIRVRAHAYGGRPGGW